MLVRECRAFAATRNMHSLGGRGEEEEFGGRCLSDAAHDREIGIDESSDALA